MHRRSIPALLAIVDGPDLMFERMSVLLLRPDGVWLLVC